VINSAGHVNKFNSTEKLRFLLFTALVIFQLNIISCGKKDIQNESYKDDISSKTDSAVVLKDSTNMSEPQSGSKIPYHWLNNDNMPPVVIVIDDFGQISGELLQGFLDLDENVCFAILPDLPHTQLTAKQANIYRHEIIIHIPMEAQDKTQNSGKRYLKTGYSQDQTTELVVSFIKQIPQAIGVNNHMGSGATSDESIMLPLMKTLKANQLFFLDSRTTSNTKAGTSAFKYSVDYISRDMFLDVPDVSTQTLNSKLKDLDKFRGRAEPVIVITHCHSKLKLEAVKTFIVQIRAMGIDIIPLSEAVDISRHSI
jgi:polysaccharide deacetylase 2 family uncharacterized protein YibQ